MIDIEDDAQAELIFETLDELQTLLRLKRALLNYKFVGNADNADLAFEMISKSLSDLKYSIFGFRVLPCKESIND